MTKDFFDLSFSKRLSIARNIMLRRRPDFVIPRKLNQQIEPRSSDYVLAPMKNAINHHRDNIDRLVETLQPLIDEYAVKPSDGDANSDGAYFGAADSACAYAMVRHFKPKLILEIGCGQSTHVMRKALDDTKYGGGDAGRIVSIDPAPRKSIEQVADQIYYSSVLNVEPDIFDKLQSGDILFIDGSHYSFNVTDVTYLFLEILPCLMECAPGPGQVMYKELTGDAGLSEDESHGKAPHIQYRIQAAGGAGVSRRGESSRALPAPRRLA